jgi:hypothetical protein
MFFVFCNYVHARSEDCVYPRTMTSQGDERKTENDGRASVRDHVERAKPRFDVSVSFIHFWRSGIDRLRVLRREPLICKEWVDNDLDIHRGLGEPTV